MNYAERAILETEGSRGAAERGWLGEAAQEQEMERKRQEWEEYQRQQDNEQ